MDMFKIIVKSCVLLCIISFHNIKGISAADWFDVVIDKVSELNMYQVTIFINSDSVLNFPSLNLLYDKIVCQIPSISIDLNDKKDKKKDQLIKLPTFSNPRKVNLFFIVQNEQEFHPEKVIEILDFLAERSTKSTRPKCILILFNLNTSLVDLNKLLYHAWLLKFLDFIILIVNSNNETIFLDYNPFTKIYSQQNLTSKEELFPNKLKNMNGHAIYVPHYYSPPKIIASNSSNKISYSGVDYNFIDEISKSLNYSIRIVTVDNQNSIKCIIDILRSGSSAITISPVTLLKAVSYRWDLNMGKALWSENIGMTVPILYITKVTNLINIILYLSFSSVIILIVIITAKILQFTFAYWTVFYIFQILLGTSVEKRPNNGIEKLIYLCIALISIKYSSDTTAFFTDNKIIFQDEISFNALEQLNNPTLPMYANKAMVGEIMNNNVSKILQKLQWNTIKINSFIDCLEMIVLKKDRICIGPVVHIEYYIAKFRNPDKTPTIKLAKPFLMNDFAAFSYEKGSPFAEKFDAKFQQIVESGIQKIWKYQETYLNTTHKSEIIFLNNLRLSQLIIILSVGYLVSLIVFISEVSYYKILY